MADTESIADMITREVREMEARNAQIDRVAVPDEDELGEGDIILAQIDRRIYAMDPPGRSYACICWEPDGWGHCWHWAPSWSWPSDKQVEIPCLYSARDGRSGVIQPIMTLKQMGDAGSGWHWYPVDEEGTQHTRFTYHTRTAATKCGMSLDESTNEYSF